jgi:hypothetical protein
MNTGPTCTIGMVMKMTTNHRCPNFDCHPIILIATQYGDRAGILLHVKAHMPFPAAAANPPKNNDVSKTRLIDCIAKFFPATRHGVVGTFEPSLDNTPIDERRAPMSLVFEEIIRQSGRRQVGDNGRIMLPARNF